MKRIRWECGCLLVVVAGACVLIWGGGHAARWLRERPVFGALSHAEELRLPLRLDTGAFQIAWLPEDGGAIVITHDDMPNQIVWASIPGTGFVGAALGHEQVTERRGMFSFRDRIRRRYPNQHMERISVRDGPCIWRDNC